MAFQQGGKSALPRAFFPSRENSERERGTLGFFLDGDKKALSASLCLSTLSPAQEREKKRVPPARSRVRAPSVWLERIVQTYREREVEVSTRCGRVSRGT